MSTYYLPFGDPAIVVVQIDEYQDQDGYWNLGARCTQNKLGDLSRFVYRGDTFLGVASPMEDVGVPLAPETGYAGSSRTHEVLFRFSQEKEWALRETREGILAALDEYVRAKILFRDHMVVDKTYYFQEA